MTSNLSSAQQSAQNDARDHGRFGEQPKASPGTSVLPDPLTTSSVLTGPEPELFDDETVRRLSAGYDDAGMDRYSWSDKLSVVRAKRLADLATHLFPGAATIVLEPDCDGNDNVCFVTVKDAAGDPVPGAWTDDCDLIIDEARDLYSTDPTWLRLATTEDQSYWYLDVAKAQALRGSDYGLPVKTGEVGVNEIAGVAAGTTDAFTCEGCGRSWMEETPAGRCPWEYEHHTDNDED